MIEAYNWPTSNGRKIFIMLEEAGLPYTIHPVNINKGDQFKPEFLEISPNNKIPAIVDTDGPGGKPISIFESGATLIYLAKKARSPLFPADEAQQYKVLSWLFMQVGHVGPTFGQVQHFLARAQEGGGDYALQRFTKETNRIYGVLDRRLGEADYLAGEYSVADIAVFPWTQGHEKQGQRLSDYPNVKRWFRAIRERPAVQKALTVAADMRRANRPLTEEARAIMFGDKQYERR